MRRFGLFLVSLALACKAAPTHPANIDGVVPPPPGGGVVSDAGADGALPPGTFSTVANARGLAIAGAYLYIASVGSGGSTGVLVRVPINGGSAETLVENVSEPWAIAASDTRVSFTTASSSSGDGAVYGFLLGATTIDTLVPSVNGAYGLVMDSAAVYFTEGTGTLGVERRSLTTSAVDRIVTSAVLATGNALRIAGSDLFVGASNGIVYRAPVLGGVLEGLDAPLTGSIVDIALDSTTVFAAVDLPAPNGAIVSFPKLGGAVKYVVTGLDRPGRIAVDSNRLYYTNPTLGTVESVPTTGGTPVVIGSNLSGPYALAVGDAVYVGTQTGVTRLTK